MWKYLIFIIAVLIAMCTPKQRNYAGAKKFETIELKKSSGGFQSMNTYCLLDFLTDPDRNGRWTIVSKPDSSTLSNGILSGTDNPCIDFNNFGCGDYSLKYLVKNPCCIKDSVIIDLVLPCCQLEAFVTCT